MRFRVPLVAQFRAPKDKHNLGPDHCLRKHFYGRTALGGFNLTPPTPNKQHLATALALSKSGPPVDFDRLPGKNDSCWLVWGYHFLDTPIMQACFCRQVDSICWLLLIPTINQKRTIYGSTLLAWANKPWSFSASTAIDQALPSWKLTWTISNEVQKICFLLDANNHEPVLVTVIHHHWTDGCSWPSIYQPCCPQSQTPSAAHLNCHNQAKSKIPSFAFPAAPRNGVKS